jgi:hypothetical protein
MEDRYRVDSREFTISNIAVLSKFIEKPHRLFEILMRVSHDWEAVRPGREINRS